MPETKCDRVSKMSSWWLGYIWLHQLSTIYLKIANCQFDDYLNGSPTANISNEDASRAIPVAIILIVMNAAEKIICLKTILGVVWY